MNTLDLGLIGNCSIGALINPLAEIVWACLPRPDGDQSIVPKIAFFTSRSVCAGEELTWNYGGGDILGSSDVLLSTTVCKCGAKNCRGLVPRAGLPW